MCLSWFVSTPHVSSTIYAMHSISIYFFHSPRLRFPTLVLSFKRSRKNSGMLYAFYAGRKSAGHWNAIRKTKRNSIRDDETVRCGNVHCTRDQSLVIVRTLPSAQRKHRQIRRCPSSKSCFRICAQTSNPKPSWTQLLRKAWLKIFRNPLPATHRPRSPATSCSSVQSCFLYARRNPVIRIPNPGKWFPALACNLL